MFIYKIQDAHLPLAAITMLFALTHLSSSASDTTQHFLPYTEEVQQESASKDSWRREDNDLIVITSKEGCERFTRKPYLGNIKVNKSRQVKKTKDQVLKACNLELNILRVVDYFPPLPLPPSP